MSEDPYHVVKAEIQTSLQTASNLRSSYARIASTASPDSEELRWAETELKATLATLDADLEDLDESVQIVEGPAGRSFGLTLVEVAQRREYVSFVRKEINSRLEGQKMRADIISDPSHKRVSLSSSRPPAADSGASPTPEDDQSEWERQEQAYVMQQQDSVLTSIGGTLTTLAEQAGLMGRELGEQSEMLSHLEAGIDRTQSKLGSAMKKMNKFIRDTEETKSGWCIGILIVILLCLLLAVVLL